MKNELKRSIVNGGMLLSVVLAFIILFHTFVSYDLFVLGREMDIISVLTYPMAMSSFIPFASLFVILPYGLSYLEERNSGYYQAIIMRSGKKTYVGRKIAAVGWSGGMALVIPFTAIFLIAWRIAKPVSQNFYPEMYRGTIWEPYLLIGGGILVLLMRLVLIFLFGVIWSEMALLVSVFVSNRYISFIVPFVISQMAWFLLPNEINPIILFRADFIRGGWMQIYTPFLIQVLAVLLLCIVNAMLMNRRLQGDR